MADKIPFKQRVARGLYKFMAGNVGWDFISSGERYRPQLKLASTDDDLNYGTREEMMSEARALTQSFGIAARILNQFANYTVGNCAIKFDTGNPEWDKLAEEYFCNVAAISDARGRLNLRGLAKLAVKSLLRDGDIGFAKVIPNKFPQLLPFEADRIRSDSSTRNSDRKGRGNFVSGVMVDNLGRYKKFRVWNREFHGRFVDSQEIDAADFLFIVDNDRFDGIRGVTRFSPAALNHMRDMLEILRAEKRGVKTNSRIALLEKRHSASVAKGNLNLWGTNAAGTSVYTEDIDEGVKLYRNIDENVDSFVSNRPSPAWQGFMDYLIRDIAISFDIPYSFVWNMSGMTGPAIRLESKQAERTFLHVIEVLEHRLLFPYASWVILDAMDKGMLDENPNWTRFKFPRPAHPSIDAGRDSVADIAEHARAWSSGEDNAEARGTTMEQNMRRKAKEYRLAKDIAEEMDVPVEAIIDLDIAPKQPPPNENDEEVVIDTEMMRRVAQDDSDDDDSEDEDGGEV